MDLLRKIQKAARDQEWGVTQTRKGHWAFTSPHTGDTLVFSGTPSDMWAIRNHVARMKRHGFVWPWDKRTQREWKRRKEER